MIPIWWSCVLTGLGIAGQYFVYRRSTGLTGPVIAIGAQSLWFAYGVATGQYPFILSALLYAGVNVYGLQQRLTKENQSA